MRRMNGVAADDAGSNDAARDGTIAPASMPDVINVDNRKDWLLLLLAADHESPVVGVTRLQKYAFLLQNAYEWDKRFHVAEPYSFEAYHFGPFDSQIYDDLAFLENVGLIESHATGQAEARAEREELEWQALQAGTAEPDVGSSEAEPVREYRLTDRGREFAGRLQVSSADLEELEQLKTRWNQKPLTQFLRWLYNEYPEYAAETKLTHLKPQP